MMSSTRIRRAAAVTAAISIFSFTGVLPSLARDADNPDWPCQQRKVVNLTSGALWDGPSVDDLKDFNNASDVREFARYLIARRIPLDQAETAIKTFSDKQAADARDGKLTSLFAAVLSYTNSDRRTVMSGIERFNKRQLARAAELERQGVEISKTTGTSVAGPNAAPEAPAAPPMPAAGPTAAAPTLVPAEPGPSEVPDPVEKYNWDVRVFQERQQNLPIACEIPTLMEQRAYEIGRLIRQQMKS